MSRRALLTLASLLILVIIAVAILAGVNRPASSAPGPAQVRPGADVPLARATYGPYTVQVRAQGRVGTPAGGEARLAFTNSGLISGIDVHVGQAVSAGQPLAELDRSGLALDLAQARSDASAAAANYGGGTVPGAALAGAQARLSTARERVATLGNGIGGAQSDRQAALAAVRQSASKLAIDERVLERQQTLYAGGVAARKDLEAARGQLVFDVADADANRAKAASAGATIGAAVSQARADLAQAQSDVRAAQAQVTVAGAQADSARSRAEAAQRNLALSTLHAPSDGVVTAILKHAGEAVDPTQPAVIVGPPTTSTVTLIVDGADARSVAPGDPVLLRVASGAGAVHGVVRSVVPSVDPATQATTIVVTGTPAGAVPGDAVDATIDVGTRYGIIIPTGAIVEDPQTGKSIVFVRERQKDGSDRFVSRTIAIAAGDEQRSLVERGLRAGEPIAAQGAFDLLAPGGGS